MMKKSTKMLLTGAATLLAVALASGGAYAATGSLTTVDAPGQVLHVAGVGPASEHASENGLLHANPNARGLFGWSTESTHGPKIKDDARDKAVKDKDLKDKVLKDKGAEGAAGDEPAPAVRPAKDKTSTKKQPSSSVDDGDADENESSGHVEAVAPDDAVEVERHSDESDESDESDDDKDAEDAKDSDDDSDDSDESDD